MGQNQSTEQEDFEVLGIQQCAHQIELGHIRPLPPPQSRDSVNKVLRKFQAEKHPPPAEQVLGPTGIKRASYADESDISSSTEKGASTTQTTVLSAKSSETHTKKKRRLVVNEQAVKLAHIVSDRVSGHEAPSSGPNPIEANSRQAVPHDDDPVEGDAGLTEQGLNTRDTAIKVRGPFSTGDSDDEGYCTYSPSSAEASFCEEDDQDRLVMELAKLHRHCVVSAQDATDEQVPTPPDLPTLRKLREEDEAAEQSRLLREKKQLALKHGSTATIASPHNDAFGDDLFAFDNDAGPHQRTKKDSTSASLDHSHPQRTNKLDGINSDAESAGFDRLREYTQSRGRGTFALPEPRLRRINPKTPQYHRFPPRQNPKSRLAAEKYRTQSRHLDKTKTPTQLSTAFTQNEKAESRLRALTGRVHKQETSTLRPEVERFTSPPLQPRRKFHAIDTSSHFTQARFRSDSPSSDILSSRPEEDFSHLDEFVPMNSPSENAGEHPVKTLSGLEMLAKKAAERERLPKSFLNGMTEPALTLGVQADIDSENYGQVRGEYERLKEQRKDLESIELTGLAIAKIKTFGELTQLEAKEEHEFRKFVSIVLDSQRSGKARRTRMTNIRSNFTRRLDKTMTDPDECMIQQQYIRLLGKKRVQMLSDLQEPLDDLINDLHAKKTNLRYKTKHGKLGGHKKRVRFAEDLIDESTGRLRHSIADGTEIDLDGRVVLKKRIRPPGKEEQEMMMIRAQLERYEAIAAAKKQKQDTVNEDYRDQDSESEVSEEDPDGGNYSDFAINPSAESSFTAPASFPGRRERHAFNFSQDLGKTNRLEAESQHDDIYSSYGQDAGTRILRGSQRPDSKLVERMHNARLDELPFDDVAEMSDSDMSDASTTSSYSSWSDLPTIVQRNKYTVTGQFIGIDIYNPEEQYILKAFMDRDRANHYIKDVMSSVAAEFKTEANEDWEWNSCCRNGLYEQVLALGQGDAIQAKVWVECDTVDVDLGKIQAKKARQAIIGEERGIWMVDWEKTVTTTITADNAAATPAHDVTTAEEQTKINDTTNEETTFPGDDDDESIFGQSPAPQAPTTPLCSPPALLSTAATKDIVTLTRPSPEELSSLIFTTPALANRAAKQLYIQWYAQFFPEHERPHWGRLYAASGSPYEGALKQVDLALETELEQMGGMGLGQWEQSVQDKRAVDEEEGGNAEERYAGEEHAVQEGMRVWVRRVGVQGPTN